MAIRIDTTKPFSVELDLADYVKKVEGGFGCTKCEETLVRIEPNGILGNRLNQLDAAVVLDHHLARHNPDPMRTPKVDPRDVFGL